MKIDANIIEGPDLSDSLKISHRDWFIVDQLFHNTEDDPLIALYYKRDSSWPKETTQGMIAIDPDSLEAIELPPRFQQIAQQLNEQNRYAEWIANWHGLIYILERENGNFDTFLSMYGGDGMKGGGKQLPLQHTGRSIHKDSSGRLVVIDNMGDWYAIEERYKLKKMGKRHDHFIGNPKKGFTPTSPHDIDHLNLVSWNGKWINVHADYSYLDGEGVVHAPINRSSTMLPKPPSVTTGHYDVYGREGDEIEGNRVLDQNPIGAFVFVDDNTLVVAREQIKEPMYHLPQLSRIELTKSTGN